MNGNETRTLWISIGAALFAVFLLYSWSQEQKTAMARKFGSTKRVVIAKEDIAEMETVDESKLDYVDQPVDFIQPDAVSEPENAIGQVAAVPIKKGEQLLQTKLLLPGPETGLAMEVSPGKRAVTIPVDDMRGVSRLLRPGDRVDIVAALDSGKGSDAKREVRTILQDVPVLAAGVNVVNRIPRRFEAEANGKILRINLNASTSFTTIVVEATPAESQQLIYILATSPGSLFTTLRHPNDRQVAPVRTVGIDDLLARPAVVVRPPEPAPVMAPPRLPAKVKTKRNGFEEL